MGNRREKGMMGWWFCLNRSRSSRVLLASVSHYLAGCVFAWLVSFRFVSRSPVFDLAAYQTIFLLLFLLGSCLAEEIFFRFALFKAPKALLHKCKAPEWMKWIVMALSSIVFALAHCRNPEIAAARHAFPAYLIYFAAGMCFCCAYEASDRLHVPIALHLLNNILSTFVVKNRDSVVSGGTSLFVSDLRIDSALGMFCELMPLVMASVAAQRAARQRRWGVRGSGRF